MAQDKHHGRIPLDKSEFYLEAAKCCDQAAHHIIKAVDSLNAGWTTRGALLNLYQANLRALERGVKITRIQSAKYFGTKTRESSHVEKYLRLFDLIDHVAHSVVEHDEKILPAAMVGGRGT